MRRRSPILFILLNVIISVGVALAVISFFMGRNPDNGTAPQLVTVQLIITATRDPNVTPQVIVVTATPLPGQVAALPTGLLEAPNINLTSSPVATLDPAVVGASAALQGTATALPQNCILHTLVEGDTPFGVATIYGADPFAMLEVNGLTEETSTLLQVGDVLIVPLEGCSITPAASSALSASAAEATEEATEESTAEATGEVSTTGTPQITRTPTTIPTLTLAPTAVNAQVEIVQVLSAGDVTAEGVEIRNVGGVVDLTGWILSDSEGNEFTFPEQRLFTNGLVTVYTRVGQDTPIALYWKRSSAVFGDAGDVVTLTDAQGRVQSTFRLTGGN
jgi:hypothetical protein